MYPDVSQKRILWKGTRSTPTAKKHSFSITFNSSFYKCLYESTHFFVFLVVSHDSIRGCVRPSVGPLVRWSVGPLVMLLSAGRDEPANDLFRVYELISVYRYFLYAQFGIRIQSFFFKDYFLSIKIVFMISLFVLGISL